jgi:hypothetical protein
LTAAAFAVFSPKNGDICPPSKFPSRLPCGHSFLALNSLLFLPLFQMILLLLHLPR